MRMTVHECWMHEACFLPRCLRKIYRCNSFMSSLSGNIIDLVTQCRQSFTNVHKHADKNVYIEFMMKRLRGVTCFAPNTVNRILATGKPRRGRNLLYTRTTPLFCAHVYNVYMYVVRTSELINIYHCFMIRTVVDIDESLVFILFYHCVNTQWRQKKIA